MPFTDKYHLRIFLWFLLVEQQIFSVHGGDFTNGGFQRLSIVSSLDQELTQYCGVSFIFVEIGTDAANTDKLTFWNVFYHMFGMVRRGVQVHVGIRWL